MSDLLPIPPTSAVADPQARSVLDALAHNSRITGDAASADNVRAVALQAAADVLAGRAVGTTPLDALATRLLTSRLMAQLRSSLGIQSLEDVISAEERKRMAGLSRQEQISLAHDYALASAINRLWASIGGSAAVIEDGTLASATPSTATATKWDQVVAAVTDPNTGAVVSAALKETFDAYASTLDGRVDAMWTLRLDVNGYVAGIGLANDGATADLIINADSFAIAAPGRPAVLPFVVDATTGNLRLSGDLYANDGTFSGTLSAATGTFAGALLAATGTFSGTLTADAVEAVSTINLANNAVSVTNSASGTSGSVSTNLSIPAGQTWKVLCVGFQDGYDEASIFGDNTPDTLTVNGQSASLLSITVDIGADSSVYRKYTQAGCVASVATVAGPTTFAPSLDGQPGVNKTILLIGYKK